jgi:hypothetical protein
MAISQTVDTLVNIGDTAVSNLTGGAACLINITGTYTGLTVVFEASIDGVNWFGVVAYRSDTNAAYTGSVVLGAVNRAFMIACGIFADIRVRCTAIGSGSVTVTEQNGSVTSLPIVPENLVQYKATNVGKLTTAVVAGSGNANVVAIGSGPGILHSIVVTTAGSATVILYDNATTNSGTIMYKSPATYPLGVTNINATFQNGITVRQASGSAAITLTYTLL